MSAIEFLDLATLGALALTTLALFLTFVRLLLGPTLPDRIMALDLLTTLVMGYVALVALRTGFSLYVDIAIAMALAGFVATVALARFALDAAAAGADGTKVLADGTGSGRQFETSSPKDEARRQ